ncbi:hypothetical protein CDAR_216921, partial [Caerostris darwini]
MGHEFLLPLFLLSNQHLNFFFHSSSLAVKPTTNEEKTSKAIRYRPSSNHKRCQPAIRLCSSNDTPGSFRETKACGFRG